MAITREERRSFSVITLGCKLNQYESELLRQALVKNQWTYRRFEDGARFYIINSCTVTGRTDSRTRNFIRRARRISPDATIIVTGCYAETQPEKLTSMNEVDLVLGNSDKESIPRIMNGMIGNHTRDDRSRSITAVDGDRGEENLIDNFLDHSRAFIKIQEGCNASCSYCIIPQARGRSRSVPVDRVLKQVKLLERNGYQEIVLTGIHIGRYGFDTGDRFKLADLIESILEQTEILRVRLSSIEVTEITPGLIELMSRTERLASHFHIPLQSGDDEILSTMNRPYSVDFFSDKIEEIHGTLNGAAIGTDIIVGFPGETEQNFKNTYRVVSELPISYFHVFNFSRRPGTKAPGMPGQIPPETRKKRSKKLIKLGKSKKRAFMRSLIGSTRLVLVQGPEYRFSRFAMGLTGNYCEVFLKCPSPLNGELAPVTITHYSRGRLYGRLIGNDSASRAETRETR